jgi:predicted transcriptional regulator
MKIAHYEQMMDYLTGPRESFRNGGRIGFSKGGAAKVYDYLESLPEGTEIDLNFVRDYVEKNNIDADANNVFKNFYEIDRKQKAASGNITFKHGEERRKQLQRIKNKLVFKKLKEFIPATKENLEKLDNLIKNTDLNVEQIGKELGFRNPKSLKFTPTSKNVLVKEYIEKYGNPSEGRFKRRLTPDSEIVKKAIELKETPLSTRQIARELGVSQSAVVNYFRAGNREDLIGEVPVKKEGTPVDRKKKARMENIAEGEKFASKSDKAFNKAEDLRVQKINTFLKNNSDQLVNNQKFINLVNLKLDGKGNIISKNKSPDEIAELLKKDRLFERDHISSVAKRKRNMQFPVNFQMAPQNINQGFFGAAEAYINRPDADPEKIKKLSNVLDQYGLRLSTNKGTIGAKQIPASEVIDRNLKALGLSTEIGKPSGAVPMSLGVTGDIEMAKNILQKDAATAKNLLSKGFTGFR